VYSRAVGDGVGVGVGVTTTDGVGEGVGVTTGVGVGEGVVVTTGVGVGLGEAVGTDLTTTPRLQTRLLPRLTQVNSRFFERTTVPTFLHVAPARGVFAEAPLKELATRKVERAKTNTRRIRRF